MLTSCLLLLAAVLLANYGTAREASVLNHSPSTPMSAIRTLQRSITKFSCPAKPKARLRLPKDAVAQIPEFNKLALFVTFPNRSQLLHVHNMALNRAFFFSFVWQNFNESKTDAVHLPGLLYLYLSAAADVSANPQTINGSTLLYDAHKFYPNWFTAMEFNTTLNLFAVRAVRFDNTFATINFLREPNLNAISVFDLGAVKDINYTNPGYFNAPWYGNGPSDPRYIPEPTDRSSIGGKQHQYKFVIWWEPTVKITSSFFGPPYPGQLEGDSLPVRFSQPWFDCGESMFNFNEWIVSSVSPVVDVMPRYGQEKNMMKATSVAVAAMDTYFLKIPINMCPISLGNPGPNLVAGSDRCRPSTVCESRAKIGSVNFLQSLYHCRCAAGYRYPILRSRPWTGSEYRRATKEEYAKGFQCEKIENQMLWPTEPKITYHGSVGGSVRFQRRKRAAEDEDEDDSPQRMDAMVKGLERMEEASKVGSGDRMEYVHAVLRDHFNGSLPAVLSGPPAEPDLQQEVRRLVSTFSRPPAASEAVRRPLIRHRRSPTSAWPEALFDPRRQRRMDSLFARVRRVNARNCGDFPSAALQLPGAVGFGAEKQFRNQAAGALRLAHFLSAFAQLNQPDVEVAGVRLGQQLHEMHVVGEAMAAVAGDTRLLALGVFFDRSAFVDSSGIRRPAFGPLVYRQGDLAAASFEAKDMANFGGYFHQPWFHTHKERWGTNSLGLAKVLLLASMRADPKQRTSIPHPLSPAFVHLPVMEDGFWTEPYFDCSGPVKDWLLTYTVPFFGKTATGGKLRFHGVVTASVALNGLNVDQCPGKFYEANYFQNTALCDKTSTYCSATFGDGFRPGGYECHCRKGFEFPYLGQRFFFLGETLEKQYRAMLKGEDNIFPLLKCREAGADHVTYVSRFLLAVCCVIAVTLSNIKI